MKNVIYAIVIAVCVIGAVVVFLARGSGGHGGADALSEGNMIWVKCAKCNQGYQMSEKQFCKEQEAKTRANPQPIPIPMPITCQKCGQDAVMRAYKCEKCGEIFRGGAAGGTFEDRCPKCKYSPRETKWKERTGQR
jgi:phage FluMu protein Com